MDKYIHMFNNAPHWLPYIGMMAGGVKTPFATRIVEVSLPIVIAAIWLIPELKVMTRTNTEAIASYAVNMGKVDETLNKMMESDHRMQTSIAILENNLARMEKKVDGIDDIANSKVRSIEGRIDSLEKEINRR